MRRRRMIEQTRREYENFYTKREKEEFFSDVYTDI